MLFNYECCHGVFDLQFQQVAAAEGRVGTEALTPFANRWKREDGKVAVHSTVRGACLGDKETEGWGKCDEKRGGVSWIG